MANIAPIKRSNLMALAAMHAALPHLGYGHFLSHVYPFPPKVKWTEGGVQALVCEMTGKTTNERRVVIGITLYLDLTWGDPRLNGAEVRLFDGVMKTVTLTYNEKSGFTLQESAA